MSIFIFFFFQAEDGIRDFHVTGVQTCALPILSTPSSVSVRAEVRFARVFQSDALRQRHLALSRAAEDRKSTRLNSSHVKISYAVFCLKKKKKKINIKTLHLVR